MTHNKFRIKVSHPHSSSISTLNISMLPAFQPEEYLYKPAYSQIVRLNDNKPLLHPLTERIIDQTDQTDLSSQQEQWCPQPEQFSATTNTATLKHRREAIFWDSFLETHALVSIDGYVGSGNGLDPFEAIKKRIEGSQIDDKWESTEILKMHKGCQSSSLLMTQEERDSDETDLDKEVLRILLPNQKFRQVPIASE
ncbi:hypothetical protein PPACK8108_LOCUS21177 [Phakopsora pachyrhizi]|uniref:Uncharacterized protein n=1 Tax=Phakopsora pachyrhizi TaxID=170000 RepID=A0AAV0BH40_PHAPC|nr:hypothetical protein PPACK8108_LOCUS21177 [Phakopsora pachyrhizi]